MGENDWPTFSVAWTDHGLNDVLRAKSVVALFVTILAVLQWASFNFKFKPFSFSVRWRTLCHLSLFRSMFPYSLSRSVCCWSWRRCFSFWPSNVRSLLDRYQSLVTWYGANIKQTISYYCLSNQSEVCKQFNIFLIQVWFLSPGGIYRRALKSGWWVQHGSFLKYALWDSLAT